MFMVVQDTVGYMTSYIRSRINLLKICWNAVLWYAYKTSSMLGNPSICSIDFFFQDLIGACKLLALDTVNNYQRNAFTPIQFDSGMSNRVTYIY